ncbi:MAG: c-type cytochrome biogenesis protein CcmI [Pseudomonadota bacterium]
MTALLPFVFLTAIAVSLLALPFLRRRAVPKREAFDLNVYRDQLGELERDLERGIIDDEAARGARLEIERRIIAIADQGDASASVWNGISSVRLAITAALIFVVPVASALLYLQIGEPAVRDQPIASRMVPQQPSGGRALALANIQRLQEQVDSAPDDTALWVELARTQLQAGLYGDAAGSYNKAIELNDSPMLRIEMGETIVQGAEGLVTRGALEQFQTALESVPNEPRAHYYIGLAATQEGDVDGAVDTWRHLLAISPNDAPFRSQIISSIRGALEANGRPADAIIASLPEGTASTGGNAGPHAGNEQIRAMVEGLAARLENEPDDVEGWLMLGRSRMVLDEPDLAKAAFERARALAPDNPDVLLGYAASLLEPSETPGGDPVVGEEAIAIYEQLVELTPDDPEPRWLLGLSAAQLGDKEGAIGHWRDLLGLLEEGTDDHGIVEARIVALETDEPAAALAAGVPTLAPNSSTQRDRRPASGPQPTDEDRAEMAALSPEDRSDRIRAMVEGLAARLEDDPSDIKGWLRLAQSRTVLGEPDAAKKAYERAMEQAPGDTDVLRAYAGSLLGGRHPETNTASVGAEAVDLYRKIVAIDPDDPEAHWYLGLAAVQQGTIDDAKSHWRRVLDVLGPDHPNYAAVQSSLEQVETKTQ